MRSIFATSPAIGMRKGETKLQTWINQWVAKNTENGKLAEIYKRFHG